MLVARYKDDGKCEAGIDEAGRGCFWGPMVAAAVIWPDETAWTHEIREISKQIRDSKKVSPKKRAILFEQIKTHALSWAIGRVEASEIDELGMSATNRLAFERAIGGLDRLPERLLIDGILSLDKAKYTMEQVVEPKADTVYIAVAAASIIAKEGRDRMVLDACAKNPSLQEKYTIGSSKGYGIATHSAGILKHGLDEQHRRLFLRNLLGRNIHSNREMCLIQD